jgi:hypothetical protein
VTARIVLALVAVVVVAWLAVLERDTRVESQSYHQAAKGKVESAQSGLRRAGLLNPDTHPDVIRSVLYLVLNNRAKATSVIEGVLSREPDNVVAWNQLLTISRGYNSAAVRRSLAEIKRLDPLDAPSS